MNQNCNLKNFIKNWTFFSKEVVSAAGSGAGGGGGNIAKPKSGTPNAEPRLGPKGYDEHPSGSDVLLKSTP